jgi:hypothetical protein
MGWPQGIEFFFFFIFPGSGERAAKNGTRTFYNISPAHGGRIRNIYFILFSVQFSYENSTYTVYSNALLPRKLREYFRITAGYLFQRLQLRKT